MSREIVVVTLRKPLCMIFCWFIHLSKTIPIDVVTYCPQQAISWGQCFSFSEQLYPVPVGREMQEALLPSLCSCAGPGAIWLVVQVGFSYIHQTGLGS